MTSLKPELTFIIDDKQSALATLPQSLLQFYSALTRASASPDQALIPLAVSQDVLPLSTSIETLAKRSACPVTCSESCTDLGTAAGSSTYKSFPIPLKSDSQFFSVLTGNLQALDVLREEEEMSLKENISSLGQAVVELTMNENRTGMQVWREIFRLYLDCNIFFSTSGQELHRNSATTTQERLKLFSDRLNHTDLVSKMKSNSARATLKRFSTVNLTLLRHLQYQELNKIAMAKILKSEESLRS